jgi:RNA polymerase-binding transcription factor DksA
MAQTAATSLNGLSKIDVAQIRVQLLAMRVELEARMSERDVLDLKRVEAALVKLASGAYGACESCDRPVLKARLLETPHVRYCSLCSGGRNTQSQQRRAPATA